MEVQLEGMANTREGFELKLRAAGASEPVRFCVEELVWAVPSSSGGAQTQVRLIRSVPSDNNDHESEADLASSNKDEWTLESESEVSVDAKEGVARVVQMDRVRLQGNAPEVLAKLKFDKLFSIGRIGTRVTLPGGWTVEYFDLFDVPSVKSTRKRTYFQLESGKTGWLVTIRKSFENERDSQANVTDGLRISKRLMPDLELAKSLEVNRVGR